MLEALISLLQHPNSEPTLMYLLGALIALSGFLGGFLAKHESKIEEDLKRTKARQSLVHNTYNERYNNI